MDATRGSFSPPMFFDGIAQKHVTWFYLQDLANLTKPTSNKDRGWEAVNEKKWLKSKTEPEVKKMSTTFKKKWHPIKSISRKKRVAQSRDFLIV